LPETLFARTRSAQRLESISLSAEGFIDLAFEFLFLLRETAKLRLYHFDIAFLIHTITVVTSSRAKMNLTDAVVFHTSAAFLNHGVSESVEKVGEVDTAGGAVGGSTDSRHLAKAMITEEVWGTRPSYLDLGTELGQEGDSVIIASGRGRR
jgi:hypothetical protein